MFGASPAFLHSTLCSVPQEEKTRLQRAREAREAKEKKAREERDAEAERVAQAAVKADSKYLDRLQKEPKWAYLSSFSQKCADGWTYEVSLRARLLARPAHDCSAFLTVRLGACRTSSVAAWGWTR